MSCAAAPACINDQFVKSGCYCLNESASNQYTNLFVGDHTLGVRSDSDEQMIIHLAFLQTFKLSSVSFGIPGDESCPATIKLFANVNNLGFSEATGKFPNSHRQFWQYHSKLMSLIIYILVIHRQARYAGGTAGPQRGRCAKCGHHQPTGRQVAARRVM